jgi:hypothetical protein
MKLIIFFALLAGVAACAGKKTEPIVIKAESPCNCDDSIRIEMLEGRIGVLQNQFDASRMEFDSVNTALFKASYKVERVRYYLNICLRNPSQDKFLKGWIRRAIE